MKFRRGVFRMLISLSAMTLAAECRAKDDLIVGACTLVEQKGNKNGEYLGPLEAAENYLANVEHRKLDGAKSPTISLVQPPKHGVVSNPPSAFRGYYFYKPHADYLGFDSAMFSVDIGGYRLRLIHHIHVMKGVPGGTDGWDPYEDKRYCPYGPVWKVSVATPIP